MKITQSLDNFDSQDSYFIEVFVSGNNLAVPYSNLGVSDHPDINGGETAYISQAVLLVRDLKYLKVNDTVVMGERPPFGEKVWFFGGMNLNGEGGIQEFELDGGDVSYLIPEKATIADFPFPPPNPGDAAMQDFFFLELPEFPEIMEIKGWVPSLFKE